MNIRSIQTICFAVMFRSWLVYGQATSVPELDQMQAKFEAEVQERANQPFAAALLKLNQTYAASLDKEIVTAQRSGRLNNVLQLQAEKKLTEKAEALSPQDAGDTSAIIKTLRVGYNASLAQITAERDKKLQPMTSTYAKSLIGLVSTLTKTGRIEDAKVVEQRRIDIEGSTELRRYEGTWDVAYRSAGTVRRYRFNLKTAVDPVFEAEK